MKAALLASLLIATPAGAQTVFAAASLTDAMNTLAAAWTKAGHPAPVVSTGASSALARQIEAGAPAAIFASADERWMDELERLGKLAPGTRRDVLGNDLVLVVPASRAGSVAITPGFDLAGLLGDGRLAVADPSGVPAGIYAEQALRKLGIWNSVANRLAIGESVRGALLLVGRGEARAGIVYATDARVTKDVAVAGVFPPDSHDPIVYPFAIVKDGDGEAARAFLAFITGAEGRSVFAERGFKVGGFKVE